MSRRRTDRYRSRRAAGISSDAKPRRVDRKTSTEVGTFRVASVSCYWSRVASAVGRLTQYAAGHPARKWQTSTGGWRVGVPTRAGRLLRLVRRDWCSTLMEQYCRERLCILGGVRAAPCTIPTWYFGQEAEWFVKCVSGEPKNS